MQRSIDLLTSAELTIIDATVQGAKLHCGILFVERNATAIATVDGFTLALPEDCQDKPLHSVRIGATLEILNHDGTH